VGAVAHARDLGERTEFSWLGMAHSRHNACGAFYDLPLVVRCSALSVAGNDCWHSLATSTNRGPRFAGFHSQAQQFRFCSYWHS
jgi:hypothetical protein